MDAAKKPTPSAIITTSSMGNTCNPRVYPFPDLAVAPVPSRDQLTEPNEDLHIKFREALVFTHISKR
jgi:hypothetical protein